MHRRKLLAVITAATVVVFGQTAPATASDHQSAHRGGHHSSDSGCRSTPDIAAGESDVITLTSGGIERTATVSIPATYNSARPTPLILAYHGRGSTGAKTQEFTGISNLPVIGVFPDGIPTTGKQSWQGAPYAAEGVDDVRFTEDLLDTLSEQYCVDQRRIFATGKSNGGGFAALLACRLGDRIAAFAPVAGAFYPATATGCDDRDAQPMIEFHGTADNTIEYDGGVSHGVAFPSVQQWLSGWAERNGCHASHTKRITVDATRTTWRGCDRHADLVHVAIDGGGHTWPGALAKSGGGYTSTETSATAIMWDFFRTHPLTGGHHHRHHGHHGSHHGHGR